MVKTQNTEITKQPIKNNINLIIIITPNIAIFMLVFFTHNSPLFVLIVTVINTV